MSTFSRDVADLPARFAADESIHSVQDVRDRIEQGYGAVAIKPAGKTLSLGFQVIQAAADAGLPCFVADNGCVPILVEWNKNVAARLPDFPGVKGNLVESHGPRSYGNWSRLLAAYPVPNAPWLTPSSGAFVLDDAYYAQSGGIFSWTRRPIPICSDRRAAAMRGRKAALSCIGLAMFRARSNHLTVAAFPRADEVFNFFPVRQVRG